MLRTPIAFVSLSLCALCACSASSNSDGGTFHGGAGSSGASGGGNGGASGNGGAGGLIILDSGGGGATGGGGAAGAGAGKCGDELIAIIRDFGDPHPDFEHFSGGGLKGIVESTLGADGRPVYAAPGPTSMTTGPAEFFQWYHDTPGVNIPLPYTIKFTQPTPGHYLYDNSAFFPIDNQGFGNGPGFFPVHNFLFTTEIHTSFTYKGGEIFSFRGDDDLWVFVNKKLVIDLGGLHSALADSADFDALASTIGLVKGQSYPMDIFHAERHTNESNFRVETTIECFVPTEPPK